MSLPQGVPEMRKPLFIGFCRCPGVQVRQRMNLVMLDDSRNGQMIPVRAGQANFAHRRTLDSDGFLGSGQPGAIPHGHRSSATIFAVPVF